ncbi:MAG: pentapeptide repeat-containing protein [Proteobacteria bacterium]|nr:pentapeptide repeat-containing protein [Pseudomonadota bacterium]
MASEEAVHRSLDADELQATMKADRAFIGLRFAAPLALDDLDLGECRFERCQFAMPVIRGADFSRSTLRDCIFEPTRFTSCKLAHARFERCTLFDVRHKKGCSFAFCDLQAMEAAMCNFATSVFDRCDLYNASAVECSFRGAGFNRSTFTKVLSKRSTLTKATFDRCNFSFADLSGLNLQNSEFLSCKFSEASFIDTDLSHATMLACTLDRVEWERARLGGCDLRGSRLAGLNLAVLADYAGLVISESEQSDLLRQLGVEVCAE